MLETESELVEYEKDNTLNHPTDSLYSVMGIINRMQIIADRTVLLGEVRADLMSVTDAASSDLKRLAAFDTKQNKLELDRSKSGIIDFNPSFAQKPVVVNLNPRSEYKCQLFVDKLSTELFINDGDMVFTNCVFPNEVYNSFSVLADGIKVAVKDVAVYELK